MNPIHIPFHLVLPTLVCLIGMALIFRSRHRISFRTQPIWVSVTVFLAVYLLIVGSALCVDLYRQWDLNRYDLNQDGSFTAPEGTPAMEAALSRYNHDLVRNLSFITGFIAAFSIALVVYIIRIIFSRRRTKSVLKPDRR
jgi:hypothetical protein